MAQGAETSSRSAMLCMSGQEPFRSSWHHTQESPESPTEGSVKQQALLLTETDVHDDNQHSYASERRERCPLTLPLTVSRDRVTGGCWSDFSSICQPITVMLPTRSLSADLQQASCLDKHWIGSAAFLFKVKLSYPGPPGSWEQQGR